MKQAIVFLPILLLPFSLAFDCSSLTGEDKEFCNEALDSSLDDDEKELLIAEIISKKAYYPDHSFVYDWNTNIEFSQAPEEAKLYSSGFIKDAWLKIIAVMPSVIENELLFSGKGKILSAFNYGAEIPSNYNSGGYPGTSNGDCKREYKLTSNEYWLENYANNDYIGNERLADFNYNNDVNFKVKLKVQVKTEVKHWRWHSWCCRYHKKWGCTKRCHECRESHKDNLVHSVNIEDNKFAEYYAPSIEPSFKLINEYYGTQKGKLEIDNFSSFSLNFGDSFYRKFNYFYDLNFSLKPYYVLTLKANRFDKESFENINVFNVNDSYNFIVSSGDCSLDIFTHFGNYDEECVFDKIIDFKISTDKLVYSEDDTIKVDILPENADVRVSYGDESFIVKGGASFKAKYPFNKITADFEERRVQKVIHVRKKDSWDFAMNMGVFGSILYVFYVVIKKYFGIILQF